jgi:hypothetical protein
MRRPSVDEARLRPHLRGNRRNGERPAVAALGRRARGRGRARPPSTRTNGGAGGGGSPRCPGGRQRPRRDRRHEPGLGPDRQRAATSAVSSRLVRSASGRAVAVEITTPVPCLEVGFRFRVLGDELRGQGGFGFTGEPQGVRRSQAASIRLAPAVSDNVWLVSSDPAVKSHRHHDFDLPKTTGMQPPLIHAGRRWIFVRTYFGRQRDGSETRWLMFRDDGPVVDDLSPQRSET